MIATLDEDFTNDRLRMVRDQIEGRGIKDERVLESMRTVPRHRFVAPELASHAYDDRPLDIGLGQTISQPYMVALMTQLLRLRPTDRVLEIGTGSGYQCAVLAALVEYVFSIERVPELAANAIRALNALGITNASVLVGDGTRGRRDLAPFDAIVVTAGGPHIPRALTDQLADGGRLVCPVGSRDTQELIRLTRRGDIFQEERGTPCVFVPLIGVEGWAQ